MRRFRAKPGAAGVRSEKLAIKLPSIGTQEGEVETEVVPSGPITLDGILFERFSDGVGCWLVHYFAGAEQGSITWQVGASFFFTDTRVFQRAFGSADVATLTATVDGEVFNSSQSICA